MNVLCPQILLLILFINTKVYKNILYLYTIFGLNPHLFLYGTNFLKQKRSLRLNNALHLKKISL